MRNADNSFTQESLALFKSDLAKAFTQNQPYEKDILTASHNIESLNIMLTEQCNFRCDYCYEKFTNDIIEDETLKKTIEFLYKSESEKVEFWLFGGEITIVPQKILGATKYITDLRKNYDKKIVKVIYFTNGYIFDEVLWTKVNEMLSKSDVESIIQISYDGLNGMNYARKSIAKQNIDDKVKENLFKFNKYVRVIVRSTVSPSNINNDTSILDTAKWLERNGISEYAVNLVQEAHWDQEKSKFLVNQIKDLADWLKNYYLKNPYKKFVVFPFDMIFTRKSKSCGVGSRFASVNHNGKISPCHVMYSYAKVTNTQDNKIWGFIGDIDNGISKDKVKDFIDLDYGKIKIPQCSSCPSTICSVCPAVSATTYGDLKNTYREGYCIAMVKIQYIIEDFKKHMTENCGYIGDDSDWCFLMTIWQHIWSMTPIKKMDSINFNTMYVKGTSSNAALSHFKSSIQEFLKSGGQIKDIDILLSSSLEDMLVFSANIYNKVKNDNTEHRI